ncbi:oligopeptide transport system substrate-binding protein [Pullulanibacillus pueri]|uniref:Peptide ABC transporter substrate-binding protein n=1 Tax=Pullulanibacillus pueri TaxID=1437324 RepID=A0A8J2ZV47_9BACL|nr:peptide ABC transporter substrate-binding protein [Pullulanibacillus pueri]MBM7681620.1 oligopeptide transport system substrate-binding protein [Pullulanibacillus pueri]GGH79426.1 peptide ABC transporter substrate-binding protein [Pullulanibacillus pueri]
MRRKAKWSAPLVAILLVVSLFLTACSGGDSKESSTNAKKSGSGKEALADEQVLNLATTQDIPTLDSTLATDTVSFDQILRMVSGLYTYYNNKAVPDLSDGEPKISDDGKVYTFKIREDANWSNGDPVTADDFVYAWRKLDDPKTKSQYAYIVPTAHIKNAAAIQDENSDMYGKTENLGVKAIDDKTLQVTLDKATPYFTAMMAFASFFPQNQKFVEEQGKNYGLSPDSFLYNGPYKMTSWNQGEGWSFEKNPDYWDAKDITMDKVNISIVKDLSTRVNLYTTDKIDMVDLSEDFIDQYKDSDEYHQFLDNSVFYLTLNENKVPEFKDKRVRKAIAMVIDEQSYVDNIKKDGSVPAQALIPKNFVFSPDGNKDFRGDAPESYFKYDPKAAKKLWDEYKKDTGTKSVTWEFKTTDTPQQKTVAEFFANQIEQLDGVKIKINQQPWNNYLDLTQKGDYDIAGGSGWGPDYQDPMTFLDMWTSSNESNTSGWKNPKYDQLIKEADNLGDKPQERWEKLKEAEKVFMEDMPIVPEYQAGGAQLIKPYVKGLVHQSLGMGTDIRHAKILKH